MMSSIARLGRRLGSASVSFDHPSGESPRPWRKMTAALSGLISTCLSDVPLSSLTQSVFSDTVLVVYRGDEGWHEVVIGRIAGGMENADVRCDVCDEATRKNTARSSRFGV